MCDKKAFTTGMDSNQVILFHKDESLHEVKARTEGDARACLCFLITTESCKYPAKISEAIVFTLKMVKFSTIIVLRGTWST